MNQKNALPQPVDGKFVFQIDAAMRVRFNADGWVEEIGRGGAEDPPATVLQGKPASKRDDLCARRYYDLYARAIVIDIFPKVSSGMSGASGVIMFRDLEPGSPLYNRVDKIISIANESFNMNLQPLHT